MVMANDHRHPEDGRSRHHKSECKGRMWEEQEHDPGTGADDLDPSDQVPAGK
jgi:hypothetical protein